MSRVDDTNWVELVLCESKGIFGPFIFLLHETAASKSELCPKSPDFDVAEVEAKKC